MIPRAGLFSSIRGVLFALPFIAIGLASLAGGVGLFEIEGSRAFAVVFGCVFTGAGAFMIRDAVRSMRSAESREKLIEPGDVPALAARPVGYRTAPASLSALELYAPVLASLPVGSPPVRPGKTLGFELGFVSKGTYRQALAGGVIGLIALPYFVAALAAGELWVALFTAVAVALGAFAAGGAIKQLIAIRKLPRVEIDQEPAFLGSDVEIQVAQRGPARLMSYEVRLDCREHVTYSVGTDTRSETAVVHTQTLLDEVAVVIARGELFQRRMRVTLPDGPHSFLANSNQITWSVVIRAEIDGWPDYEAAFDFRALPRLGE